MHASLATEQLAVPVDVDDAAGGDLLVAVPGRLEPQAPPAGVAPRQVAPDEVGVPVGGEDPAAGGDLLRRAAHASCPVRKSPTIRLNCSGCSNMGQ
ncbi:hypothetical protein GCM10009734_28140 [Nonomuraea bangladeshensis]